uniref:Uncharacterized protein n=1 Tax=Oryza rufipogon TaxID=4529 RepID=A0A0E0RFW1_ORYRU
MAPRILEKALHSDIADDVIRCNILPRLPFKLTTRLKVISSTPDIVGIPSGFDFLGCCLENGILSLLASTNGLVCILYTRIGLAFDPVDKFQENTVSKFKIVKAVGARTIEDNGTKFCFATLSSNTSCWAMSSTTVYVDTKINCNNKKVAYGSGIMYWDYQEIVLWFDIATDMAGIVKIPWIQLGVEVKGPVHHDIDTSANGMLVCTTIDKGGLVVYHLVGVNTDFSWEIKHERRWIDMMKDSISAFGFCHSMQLRSGQEWKTKDKILCYNVVTGKTYGTGKELGNRYSKNPFYVYRNSMANIPHIAVPAQGKICEGSTGGCICAICGVEVKGPVHHDIDTSANGMLVCTTIDKGGLPMYHLVGVNTDFNWEIKHDRRWIDMMKDSISAFGFCHSMQLHSGLQTNLIDAGSKPALELAPI